MNACKLPGFDPAWWLPWPRWGLVPTSIQWEGNGHYYEYLPELVTWEQAHVVAENRTFMGRPGLPGHPDFARRERLCLLPGAGWRCARSRR